MSETHVVFKDVDKSYDGQTLIVKKLNLEVRDGEFLTMLGPSGSGKTTCLMMLAGFETVTRGDILIKGDSVSSLPPHKRGIGMVFQNYALFPHMTVRENLAFPLEVRKLGAEEMDKKIKRALSMVQLDEFVNRFPAQLSGGQQQRVAVARALVFEPDLVLMDEPLGALDKNLREAMQLELKHIHEQLGVTVVYVTHDQSEALTMSNRIAVFNEGIIQQLDPPSALYETPKKSFVAGFIGENNRLTGTVCEVNGDQCRVKINDQEIAAHAVCELVKGKKTDKTTLSLRPERIFIAPQENAMPNIFTAEVLEKIYLGDHIRFRLALLGSDDFVVKVPNNGEYAGINEHDKVRVGWQPENCHALDAA